MQTFVRIGGKEEHNQSTISGDEDGGSEEAMEEDKGRQALVILISKATLFIPLAVEDLQT